MLFQFKVPPVHAGFPLPFVETFDEHEGLRDLSLSLSIYIYIYIYNNNDNNDI